LAAGIRFALLIAAPNRGAIVLILVSRFLGRYNVRLKTHFAQPYTVALFATLICASPGAARTAYSSAAESTVGDVSRVHIDNFGRVSPAYYRGAQPEERDYAALAALGIKTVINLTGDDAEAGEEEMVKKAGMAYFQMPMTTHEPPNPARLTEFLAIVNEPANQPVYVHCVGGRHRTGVMTAVYRMTHDGWTAEQAFKEMKRYKFGADFLHPEFKKFVYSYPHDAFAAANPAPAVAKATGKY